jgi:hypothetical protein
MVEVALASCFLLVAPFEALTAQRHLTGLIIAIGASILVVGIDIAKLCMLGRAVPESTPLSELPARVHWCHFASKLVWVTALFTVFAVVVITSLRVTGRL